MGVRPSIDLTRPKENPTQSMDRVAGCCLSLRLLSILGQTRNFRTVVSLALQPHNQCSAINFLNASQTAMVKIVFLLLLIAICVALSYAGLWMEWRNRACRSHPIGKSYKAATSVQCGTITRPCGWLSYSPASWRQAALMAGPQT